MPSSRKVIDIDVGQQELRLFADGKLIACYAVSTAKNGINNLQNSGGTPLGEHIIRAKIGDNAPCNEVFIGRRQTGEIYNSDLAKDHPNRDWILTRILWLSGCEVGKNRLGNCDTMRRYIYIHGTPDIYPMGIALSHGCIRMRNKDIIELYNQVDVGTKVTIHT